MRALPRLWTFLLIAATSTASSAAQASVVHRCRQLDGVIAYRDTGCTAEETLISRLEVVQSAQPRAAPAGQVARTAQAGPRSESRTRNARRPRASRTHDQIVAHECRFGEQRWVQAAACPASLAAAPARGGKAVKQRVEETRLTASQVCGALRATSSANAPGEGSARRAYGMNRLRQRHGC